MMTADFENIKLIQALKGGDRRAFESFYRTNSPFVYSLALRYLKGHDEAQEIVQRAFVKLWTNRKTIPISFSPKGYIMVIARNMVLNYIRDNTSAMRHNYEIAVKEYIADDDFWARADKNDMISEMLGVVDTLPDQQRKVVKLRCEGFSNRDIARLLNLSLNTINTHYSQGLKTLKSKLGVLFSIALLLICR